MVTLRDEVEWKPISRAYKEKDVKEFLTKFHESYWEESHEGDKCKRYISCDDLDFLMDKYFGNIVDIKTLQILPNKDK